MSFVRQQCIGSVLATAGTSARFAGQVGFDTRASIEARVLPLNSVAFGFFCLFVFAIPWENALLLPGVGTVSRLLGLLALPVAVLAILERGRLRSPSLPILLIALFVVWGCLSYLWTVNVAATSIRLASWLQTLGMVWLIWELADLRERQLLLMRAYVFGTLVSAIDTLFSYFRGQEVYYQRYAGSGFDPNDLGLILALSLPISLYLAAIQKNKRMVWVYRFQQIAAILAIGLTSSRAALLATAVALAYLPVAFPRISTFRGKCALVFIVVIAGGCLVALLPATSWERWGGIGSELQHGTWGERKMIWSAGLEVFREHPLIGVGAGGYGSATRRLLPASIANDNPFLPAAHNTFLSILAEEGLVGFGLFLLLWLGLVLPVLRLPNLVRNLWLVTLATWATGVFTLTWEDRKPTWFLFGLLAAWSATRIFPQKKDGFAHGGTGLAPRESDRRVSMELDA